MVSRIPSSLTVPVDKTCDNCRRKTEGVIATWWTGEFALPSRETAYKLWMTGTSLRWFSGKETRCECWNSSIIFFTVVPSLSSSSQNTRSMLYGSYQPRSKSEKCTFNFNTRLMDGCVTLSYNLVHNKKYEKLCPKWTFAQVYTNVYTHWVSMIIHVVFYMVTLKALAIVRSFSYLFTCCYNKCL